MDDQTTVSREAHERMTRERDEAKARLAELEAVVTDIGYKEKARSFFKAKGVTDPDWAAEFALPHLRSVELDKLEETLASDRFAPLVTMATAQASPPPPEDTPSVPLNPGAQSSFSGPNPGAVGGTPPEPGKIKAGSEDYRKILNGPDGKQRLAELAQAGQVEWTRTSDPRGGASISEKFG